MWRLLVAAEMKCRVGIHFSDIVMTTKMSAAVLDTAAKVAKKDGGRVRMEERRTDVLPGRVLRDGRENMRQDMFTLMQDVRIAA
jgi:hypothetical protein